MPRKGWKTPFYAGGGRVCRPLVIPNDPQWLAVVGGALSELTKEYNWEQVGITPREAAEIATSMLYEFYSSDCGEAQPPTYVRLFRLGSRGEIQYSDDGGETWDEAEEQIIPPLPPRPEVTIDDKMCLAAANAAHVLHQVYQELLVAFETDSSINYGIGVFATILGLLLAGLFLPLAVITALINFALGAFGAAWAGLQFLADNDWTVTFHEDLVCLLRDNATVTDGVVTFDYIAVRDGVFELDGDNALKFWIFYILQVIGAEGLNAAGATTAVEDYDCNCVHMQCWSFDTLEDGWSFIPLLPAGAGSILPTEGNPPPSAGGVYYSVGTTRLFGVNLRYEFPEPVTMREVSFDFHYARTPAQNPGVYRAARFYDAEGGLITTVSVQDTPAHNVWHNWTRQVNVAGVKRVELQVGGSSPTMTSGHGYIDSVCFKWTV
jgi:hypothetical protein